MAFDLELLAFLAGRATQGTTGRLAFTDYEFYRMQRLTNSESYQNLTNQYSIVKNGSPVEITTMETIGAKHTDKKSETIIKSASVKVMISHNYNHFESSMTLENESGVGVDEIDNARKTCQRLNDKAVQQYKKAKEMIEKRSTKEYDKRNFEAECRRIAGKEPGDRTINEIAQLKVYQDENWEKQFSCDYDYEDE